MGFRKEMFFETKKSYKYEFVSDSPVSIANYSYHKNDKLQEKFVPIKIFNTRKESGRPLFRWRPHLNQAPKYAIPGLKYERSLPGEIDKNGKRGDR